MSGKRVSSTSLWKPILCIDFLLLAVCLWWVPAMSFTVSRTEFRLEVEPGNVEIFSFLVSNDEDKRVTATVFLVDWENTAEPEGVTLFFPPGTIARSCAPWIDHEPQALDLLPGEEQELRLTIDVPQGAAGTYWAALIIDTGLEARETTEGRIQVRRQFCIRIYQTSRPAAIKGEVSSLEVKGLNPLGVALEFRNTGEVLLDNVHGAVMLKDRSGVTVEEIRVSPFRVLPGYGAHVVVHSQWGLQRPGVYLLLAVLDFGADYLVAGQIPLRIRPLSLSPIGNTVGQPQDLDGDGLYEDIDGNGLFNIDDVKLFSSHLNDPPIVDNARAFDFNNDGAITQEDVECLRKRVLQDSPSGAARK